jgi:beta-glucosidase
MSSTDAVITRRSLLAAAIGAAAAGNAMSAANMKRSVGADGAFPNGFLWGAATAGHQVEGGNVNSDSWFLEHLKPTAYAEVSGDACDQYHRFKEDIALLASLGFNSYRFSLEWARIEPAPGEFSSVQLDHYRRVAATCREHGITPVITYNHMTCPRWFAEQGGWENAKSPDLFARYCGYASSGVADLAGIAATLNEPNIALFLQWLGLPPGVFTGMNQSLIAAARQSGVERFSTLMMGDSAKSQPNLLKAHQQGYDAIKSAQAGLPVGVTLAMSDDQAVGPASRRDEKRKAIYDPWLATASDFIGVQTYGRSRVDSHGGMPPEPGRELTQMHEEFWPQAIGEAIRYAYSKTSKPIYVTENGIATLNDERRVAYIRGALPAVKACLDDGIPVRGYIHWSLLDNFEWTFGYGPKFGLVSVDRQTFVRSPKPSAGFLGAIAKANRL